MKKILCVFLAIVMLTGLTLPVFAQEKDVVSINYNARDAVDSVLFYKFNNPDKLNWFAFSVSKSNLIKYDYIYIQIDYDKEMFDYDTIAFAEEAGAKISCTETDTGIYVKLEFDDSLRDLPSYQDYYGSTTVEFNVKKPGKVDFKITAYGIDLEGNRVDLDVEFENVITEIKPENNLELNFGSMFYKPDTNDDNFMWINLNINGKYHNVDKFIIHFTADKNILGISNPYSGDVHLDYFVSWQETDIGYDQIISSYNVDDYSQIHYYTNFIKKQAGIHNLSATAEVIYKDGTTENIYVDMSGLEEKILDYSLISKGDVNCDGTVTASDARSALRISAGLDTPADDIRALADFDSNGKVTAADARTILRIAAGLS